LQHNRAGSLGWETTNLHPAPFLGPLP
jgi:hypothetical protein